ncbi:MAG: histidine kinase [Bacteroidota bacterium]
MTNVKNIYQIDQRFLGFNDFWFMITGIIALGFFIPQVFFGVWIFEPTYQFHWEWLEATMYATCYWLGNRAIMIWFRKKYPNFDQTQERMFKAIPICIVATLIIGSVLTPIIEAFFDAFQIPNLIPTSPMRGVGVSFFSTFFVIAIYESIWYYSQLKKSVQEAEQVKVAHVQTQLDGLRNQVNPHFLFNSLNTLNHIVEHEEKGVAKNFINQLSKVYRYILDSREETTISLAEELEFVQSYVMIQKERFLENLKVEINIPQQYFYKKIIPLSLQLLIENAIKHNIISTKKPLMIKIEIDRANESIVVSNNLQRKSKVLHSTKVGLENITERYRLLSATQPVKVEALEGQFRVSLPLLEEQHARI